MTTQAVGQAILDDVCRDPRDWTPRHIYADWCEDNGRPQRAAVIRAMLAGRAEEAMRMVHPIAFDLNCSDLLDHAIPDVYRLESVNLGASDAPFLVAHRLEVIAFSFVTATLPVADPRWRQRGFLRGGFFEGWELRLGNWIVNADQYLSECPLRGIRLIPNGPHLRDQYGDLIRLWQSTAVGRLESLDLSQLLTYCDAAEFFAMLSRHAYRPWRGLGQLVIPSYHGECPTDRFARLLPHTKIIAREVSHVDHS